MRIVDLGDQVGDRELKLPRRKPVGFSLGDQSVAGGQKVQDVGGLCDH